MLVVVVGVVVVADVVVVVGVAAVGVPAVVDVAAVVVAAAVAVVVPVVVSMVTCAGVGLADFPRSPPHQYSLSSALTVRSTANRCNGFVAKLNNFGSFSSPGQNYDNMDVCIWHLQVPEKKVNVRKQFPRTEFSGFTVVL